MPDMARLALRRDGVASEVIVLVWSSEVTARCAGLTAARGAGIRISGDLFSRVGIQLVVDATMQF
ncbi:hypothetical protein KDW41_25130 [Burkholderia vietnamiensis]|nr:hypothetical protein [Burkholderia vietnamiensis]